MQYELWLLALTLMYDGGFQAAYSVLSVLTWSYTTMRGNPEMDELKQRILELEMELRTKIEKDFEDFVVFE